MKAAIIGDGAWGTALGLVLRDNGCSVTVWGPFRDYVETVVRERVNVSYLPGIRLPDDIAWTSDPREAARDAGVVVLAVPTKYVAAALGAFAGLLPPEAHVVSVAKGLEPASLERLSVVAARLLRHAPVAALSGPSFAEEGARRVPTAVTVASQDAGLAATLQRVLSNDRFRVYTSSDVAGVELGGALKNVIAIAVGVSDGLGFGDNTRAALITRGLAEITRLGVALGARAATFAGLSGMGDLILTCTGRLSRNHRCGERIGRGERVADILGGTKQAVEGAWNCAAARALARRASVPVPITEEVYAIIHEGKAPQAAVDALLTRDVKPE